MAMIVLSQQLDLMVLEIFSQMKQFYDSMQEPVYPGKQSIQRTVYHTTEINWTLAPEVKIKFYELSGE